MSRFIHIGKHVIINSTLLETGKAIESMLSFAMQPEYNTTYNTYKKLHIKQYYKTYKVIEVHERCIKLYNKHAKDNNMKDNMNSKKRYILTKSIKSNLN